MASLPIPASSELDQIFGGSDDEDDSMLFPMTRTATAADLLDDGFGPRGEGKGDSLLMDVLVQRPQQSDNSDDQEQARLPKDGNLLLPLKEKKYEGNSSGAGEDDSPSQNQDNDRKYGLRDRKMIRKRPARDSLYYGEDSFPQSKLKKKDEEVESAAELTSPEEDEQGADNVEEDNEEEESSEDDTLYCTCKQPHGGRFMICCDKCEEWYHGSCVGVSVAMGKRMEKARIDYVCPPCKGKETSTDEQESPTANKGKRLMTRAKLKREKEASAIIHELEPKESQPSSENKAKVKEEKQSKEKKTPVKKEDKRRPSRSEENRPAVKSEERRPAVKSEERRASVKSEERRASVKSEERRASVKSEERRASLKGEERRSLKSEDKKGPKTSEETKPSVVKQEASKPAGGKPEEAGKPSKLEEKRRQSSSEGEKGPPPLPSSMQSKKVKELNGGNDRRAKLDKLAGDRRRFLLGGDSLPDESSMKKCIVASCSGLVLPPTLFCSDGCVERYSAEALNTLLEYGMSTQGGINVIDTATGKVIMYATSRTNLVPFLKQHRSYQVHLPTGPKPGARRAGGGAGQSKQSPSSERSEEKLPTSPLKKKKDDFQSQLDRDSSDLKGSKGQKNPEDLRLQAKKALYLILSKRVQETEDLASMKQEELEAVAADIEDNLFAKHKDVNHRYKARYRSLLFNLKDDKNKFLFRRVVTKALPSDQLVRMSHDQLASEELTKWREEEMKKNIEAIKEREKQLNKKERAVRKITKKGEEEIERDYEDSSASEVEPSKPLPLLEPRPSRQSTTAEHGKHLFDSDCEICQEKIVKGEESREAESPDKPSDLGEGEDDEPMSEETGGGSGAEQLPLERERSDALLSPMEDQLSPDTAKTVSESDSDQLPWKQTLPKSAEVEKEDSRTLVKKSLYKLLHSRAKDIAELRSVSRAVLEETAAGVESGLFSCYPSLETHYKRQYRKIVAAFKNKGNIYLVTQVVRGELSPATLAQLTTEQLNPPLWNGYIYHQGLAKITATACQISGIFDHLLQMMPEVLNIVGRIPFRDVWTYLDKLKQIPSKTISVVRLDWSEEGRSAYMTLLDYLVGRQRIGVVDVKKTNIKDFYVVPLLSGEELPKVLRDLPDNIGPTIKSSGDWLLGVVVRSALPSNSQPPPPPPARHSRIHSVHKAEWESKPVLATPMALDVGIGDQTPPLPGESPALLPVATSPVKASSAHQPNAQITLYGSVTGSVAEGKKRGPTVVEKAASESSLSPLSDMIEETSEEAGTENEMAYSPSAPILGQVGVASDEEPYSPSNQAPLEDNAMDTSTTETTPLGITTTTDEDGDEDMEPYSPSNLHNHGDDMATDAGAAPTGNGTVPAVAVSISQQQIPPLMPSLQAKPLSFSSRTEPVYMYQQTQPPSLFASVSSSSSSASLQTTSMATPTPVPPPRASETTQAASNAVTNVQLQNLLLKLPILAKSLFGDKALSPSIQSGNSPSTLQTSDLNTQLPPTGLLGDSSHNNTSQTSTSASEAVSQVAAFQTRNTDPRKRSWQQ